MSTKQKFVHLKGEIPDDQAKELFTFLKEAIPWGLGVPSRRHAGITRLAYPLEYRDLKSLCSAPVISKIESAISEHSIRKEIAGVYLNYYRNGNDWTPNHTHPGSSQLVLSLGTIRKFAYGKKEFNVFNGDILLFGSGLHGVPKDDSVEDGRISIALFLI